MSSLVDKKQALCIVRERFFEHRQVFEAISGILFLGTPHLSQGTVPGPNIIELILRSTQKKPLAKNALTPNGDNSLLAMLSQEFELASVLTPILSCYEGRHSRVHKNVFARMLTRKPILVMVRVIITRNFESNH